jgi:mono/diheme cytochrome c family protein
MSNTKVLVVLAVAAALLAIGMPANAAPDGAALYKAKCAMCHGPDGTGQTPTGKAMKVRDFTSADVQKQTDAELTKIVTDGKGKMPVYKGKLTDEEIKALVAFIRTFKK